MVPYSQHPYASAQSAGLLVQRGFQLRKLLGLFFQGYGVLGLGVRLLFKQRALMHLPAFCELLQGILQLQLGGVTVPLTPISEIHGYNKCTSVFTHVSYPWNLSATCLT